MQRGHQWEGTASQHSNRFQAFLKGRKNRASCSRLAFEGFLLATVFNYLYNPSSVVQQDPIVPLGQQGNCNYWIYDCSISVRSPTPVPKAVLTPSNADYP